jgi:hypothetical protein
MRDLFFIILHPIFFSILKYNKLNKNWNAEPNDPQPIISSTEEGISLTFLLNHFLFEHIDEGEYGRLNFEDVYGYRHGPTNDEGYFNGQFRFKQDQLPWGEYYLLPNSKWQNDFPKDIVLLDDTINKNKLKHFIFFMKDSTFECLAIDYTFQFENKVKDILEVKYPKGYLDYYITMFASLFSKPTTQNFTTFTDLYIQMRSENELTSLKTELKNILKNDDLKPYLKLANNFEIEKWGMNQMMDMVKVIEKFKV